MLAKNVVAQHKPIVVNAFYDSIQRFGGVWYWRKKFALVVLSADGEANGNLYIADVKACVIAGTILIAPIAVSRFIR